MWICVIAYGLWKAGDLYCILVLAHQLYALNSQQIYTLTCAGVLHTILLELQLSMELQ